jgi:hypothetical protein
MSVAAVFAGSDVPAATTIAEAAVAMFVARTVATAAGGVASLLSAAEERLARTVDAEARMAGSRGVVLDADAVSAAPKFAAMLVSALATAPAFPEDAGELVSEFVRRLANEIDCATAAFNDAPLAASAAVNELAVDTNEATSAAFAFAAGNGRASGTLHTHDAEGVEENDVDGVRDEDVVDVGDLVGEFETDEDTDGVTPNVSVVVGDAETVDVGVADAVG